MNQQNNSSFRNFLPSAPTMETENPSFVRVYEEKQYVRGCPTPLVKICGNPHSKLTELRRAVYANLGITFPIEESWPEWDTNLKGVIWHCKNVTPDPTSIKLLEYEPLELVEKYFGKEVRPLLKDLEDWEWRNHIFALNALVFELWVVGNGSRTNETLFSLLLKTEEANEMPLVSDILSKKLDEPTEVCAFYRKNGYCKFGTTCFNKSGHKICPHFSSGNCRRGEHCSFYHKNSF